MGLARHWGRIFLKAGHRALEKTRWRVDNVSKESLDAAFGHGSGYYDRVIPRVQERQETRIIEYPVCI
jgi:hypothetical protein